MLHVSSRYDGTVYRIAPDGTPEPVATELGVACGLAFAPDGSLFVGDRTGTIHRVVDGGARVETFATLPPSVAAFHLAMGPDECSTSPRPRCPRTTPSTGSTPRAGHETLDATFGRPQGLAFDRHGVLHVVEALAGASAVYRLDAGRSRAGWWWPGPG